MGTSMGVDWLRVLWEEVLEVVGIEGVSGWKCKICDCTQICSSEHVSGEVETLSEFIMAPEQVAPEHCEIDNVAGFSMELERVDDGESPKRQKTELKCEDGGERDQKNLPWMEMDQWWRLWHRSRHRWIGKCNMNVLTAIRERVLSWAGHVARMEYSEIVLINSNDLDCTCAVACFRTCVDQVQIHSKQTHNQHTQHRHITLPFQLRLCP